MYPRGWVFAIRLDEGLGGDDDDDDDELHFRGIPEKLSRLSLLLFLFPAKMQRKRLQGLEIFF